MRKQLSESFWLPMAAMALIAVSNFGCASPAPADEDPVVEDDDGTGGGGPGLDGISGQDAGAATTTDTGATTTDAGSTATDAGAATTDAGGAATTDAGAATTDAGSTGPVDAGGPPPKKLPLPDCANHCAECANCPDTPMCVNGKSYANDCLAICDLKAYEWPTGYSPTQGKCPDCKYCDPNKDQPGQTEKWCVKTKAAKWVPVMMDCELKCIELFKHVKCDNGKCANSGAPCSEDVECNKGSVIKGQCGAKFNECAQPPTSCDVKKYNPVCGGGETYQNSCALDNCHLKGCYPLGKEAKSAQCPTSKADTSKKLAKGCDGACFDATKWPTCASDKDCKPVCGIKGQTGVSYRNKCIAKADGAVVGNCDGIAAIPGEKCSATLYESGNKGKGMGCCDLDYSIVKPFCGSKKEGKTETWVSFRSKGEYDCLTADEKNLWTEQYQGACICNCPIGGKKVCGANGQTYNNQCQAECYEGASLETTPGPCSP